MEDLTIPKELMAEAEDMLNQSFNLKVPPGAEAQRKNGYAQWSEVIVIEDAHHEVVEKNGNVHTVFSLKSKVLPAGDTVNGGRSHTVFNRINYPALAAGGDDGQRKMSLGSVHRLKQIAVAAGLDIEETGLTGDILSTLFPLQGTATDMSGGSPIIAKRFVISVRDNANRKYNNENQQDTVAFAAAGDDDA